MAKEHLQPEDRVSDEASRELIVKALHDCVETCFDRFDSQGIQCKFGTSGCAARTVTWGPAASPRRARAASAAPTPTPSSPATSCARSWRLCGALGPRPPPRPAPEGGRGRQGRRLQITDAKALRRIAAQYAIPTVERTDAAIALDLANLFIGEFTSQESRSRRCNLAPLKRQAVWEQTGVVPQGIDRMCVESMHRTHMGVDHDYRNLMLQVFRASLADGWGGARIASAVGDILFGTRPRSAPAPTWRA